MKILFGKQISIVYNLNIVQNLDKDCAVKMTKGNEGYKTEYASNSQLNWN